MFIIAQFRLSFISKKIIGGRKCGVGAGAAGRGKENAILSGKIYAILCKHALDFGKVL